MNWSSPGPNIRVNDVRAYMLLALNKKRAVPFILGSIGPPANSVLVMNVYLPYDDGTNRDDYAYYLGKIDSYIENSSSPSESFLETLTLT